MSSECHHRAHNLFPTTHFVVGCEKECRGCFYTVRLAKQHLTVLSKCYVNLSITYVTFGATTLLSNNLHLLLNAFTWNSFDKHSFCWQSLHLVNWIIYSQTFGQENGSYGLLGTCYLYALATNCSIESSNFSLLIELLTVKHQDRWI